MFSVIEAPYRLQLSPAAGSRWFYALDPVANAAGNRFELWHADMVGDAVRAVWAKDVGPYDPWPDAPPVHASLADSPTPLDWRDRYELVELSTAKEAVSASQLMLSSLGAWLKAAGAWDPSSLGLTVTEWKHLMTMGRDHFVRVVYKGFLFPFGHEASLVKISERKFQTATDGVTRVAYLRTRMFVIVRQPTVTYAHNGFPLTEITLKPLITPYIDPPATGNEIVAGKLQDAFWIQAGGQDFQFHVAALDYAGRPVEFTAPLAFIANNIAPNEASQEVVNAFIVPGSAKYVPPDHARRQRPLGGQPVAYVKETKPGDATFTTDVLRLSAKDAAAAPSGQPWFLPMIESADIDLPAVNQLLGQSQLTKVSYLDAFSGAASGDFGNVAEVFLKADGPAAQGNLRHDPRGRPGPARLHYRGNLAAARSRAQGR